MTVWHRAAGPPRGRELDGKRRASSLAADVLVTLCHKDVAATLGVSPRP
jgi:hypothetical protein